ncbi:uncharacterized protein VP01_6226g1, partial [Puccinia sorghi]
MKGDKSLMNHEISQSFPNLPPPTLNSSTTRLLAPHMSIPGVTESLKKKITNKRMPIEEKTINSGTLEEEEESKLEGAIHYSCPLGYIKLTINEESHQALLDTGSMVNIIPAGLAQKLGLVITEKPMKLKGVG